MLTSVMERGLWETKLTVRDRRSDDADTVNQKVQAISKDEVRKAMKRMNRAYKGICIIERGDVEDGSETVTGRVVWPGDSETQLKWPS